MNEPQDPIDKALAEINEGHVDTEQTTVDTEQTTVDTEQTTVDTEQTTVDTEQTTVDTEQTTVDTEQTTVDQLPEIDFSKMTEEQKLTMFNTMTGLKLESIDDVGKYAETYAKLPDYQKNIELFPKLVEKLKDSKNALSYFPDETAYKVAQMIKDNSDYNGKESILNSVLRGDVKEMTDLRVLELAAKLDAPTGVRNPLRAKLASMGLAPDEVISNYDSLEDDDKDMIAFAAGTARKQLSKLGSDIEIPSEEIDVLQEIEQELQAGKDDLKAKKETITPIAESMVEELKELEVSKDFNFKLDLTKEEKREYAQYITDSVMSGEFDLSTNEGKKQLWASVQDAVWLDKREDIIRALSTKTRETIEAEYRDKRDNAKPLDKSEPEPKPEDNKVNPIVGMLEAMISERK